MKGLSALSSLSRALENTPYATESFHQALHPHFFYRAKTQVDSRLNYLTGMFWLPQILLVCSLLLSLCFTDRQEDYWERSHSIVLIALLLLIKFKLPITRTWNDVIVVMFIGHIIASLRLQKSPFLLIPNLITAMLIIVTYPKLVLLYDLGFIVYPYLFPYDGYQRRLAHLFAKYHAIYSLREFGRRNTSFNQLYDTAFNSFLSYRPISADLTLLKRRKLKQLRERFERLNRLDAKFELHKSLRTVELYQRMRDFRTLRNRIIRIKKDLAKWNLDEKSHSTFVNPPSTVFPAFWEYRLPYLRVVVEIVEPVIWPRSAGLLEDVRTRVGWFSRRPKYKVKLIWGLSPN